MANANQVARLQSGVQAWNAWRSAHSNEPVDLEQADLRGLRLGFVDLRGANLRGAVMAEISASGANFNDADLRDANISASDLRGAVLPRARLESADLHWTNLRDTDLRGAKLMAADLRHADLTGANCADADLSDAQLIQAKLVETDFTRAHLVRCSIYGISAWGVSLADARQRDLLVTRPGEPAVTADDLEVAQFIYLLLHNANLKRAIDTIGRKGVLILGRFTPERKEVLDALREAIRAQNYLPIMFDFEIPDTRDLRETVTLLAGLARFVIADYTDASSVGLEVQAILSALTVPVLPLLHGTSALNAITRTDWARPWLLAPYQYADLDDLIAALPSRVLAPAEAMAADLDARRKSALLS